MVSVRKSVDTINVWNKQADAQKEIEATTQELKQLVGLSSVKYQPHNAKVTHRFLQIDSLGNELIALRSVHFPKSQFGILIF